MSMFNMETNEPKWRALAQIDSGHGRTLRVLHLTQHLSYHSCDRKITLSSTTAPFTLDQKPTFRVICMTARVRASWTSLYGITSPAQGAVMTQASRAARREGVRERVRLGDHHAHKWRALAQTRRTCRHGHGRTLGARPRETICTKLEHHRATLS